MLDRREDREAAATDLLIAALAGGIFWVVLIWPYAGSADPGVALLPAPTYIGTPQPSAPPSVATPSGSATRSSSPRQSSSPTVSRSPDPAPASTPEASVGRHNGWRWEPLGSPGRQPSEDTEGPEDAEPAEEAAASPGSAPAPPANRRPDMPVDAGQVSAAIARGLIVGGAAGFVVSLIGMMLVGWLRRRV